MAMSSVCLLMLMLCGCLYYAEALRGSSNINRGQVTLFSDGIERNTEGSVLFRSIRVGVMDGQLVVNALVFAFCE